MNSQVRLTMTSKRQRRMTLKRFLLPHNLTLYSMTSYMSVTVSLDLAALACFASVTLGSFPSRNAHHTKQNRRSHSTGGAQEQPPALP